MIYVCNILELPEHCLSLAPSHVVSLVAPDEQPPTPSGIATERHLRLPIHDISEPLDGHVLPQAEHVTQLIDFVRSWRHDEAPLLVHCVAGISRSMAAALITLVVKAGGREAEAAHGLRTAAAHALPNRRMVLLADDLLGCEGRLIAAREAMGPAQITALHGPLVRLPLLD
ncbi:MAG: tyrosine phosphatase family protein [Geminicoccales bacterium]